MTTPTTGTIGPDGVLLHIGPHKTGTTAIQGSLAQVRRELTRHRALYPGQTRSHAQAARVASGFSSVTGAPMPSREHWDDLVAETARAPGRVVISSEYFDVVQPERGRRIVDELGGDAVEVVITAAPLASVMPSSWQQAVRSSLRTRFEDWLRSTFDQHGSGTSLFWRRQQLDDQVRRWAEVVGLDRVRVVVTDKRSPRQLFDAFEDLIELPRGTLQPQESATNRSFTLQETELLRRVNERVAARGWSSAVHARFVRLGAVRQMRSRRPRPGEAKVVMPDWAVTRANRIARQMIAEIETTGVGVVGDLSTLVTEPTGIECQPPAETVDIAVAVRAIIGAMRGGGADVLREKAVTADSIREYPGVASAPTELLRAELKRRESRRG